MSKKKRNSFSGSIGFVLAAAGSAVGLGNIWRFPYLAAKDGGGLFLVVYIVLALTFGFTLLTAEVALGRKTKESPLTAYRKVCKPMGWTGIFSCLIPMIIMPYYCVIGGWVLKYFLAFLTGHGADAAKDGFFSEFISGKTEPIIMMVIFMLVTAFVIYRGVNKGIEGFSKIIMPILIVLVLGIAIFALTLSHQGEDGAVHTGLEGFRVYVIPNMEGITIGKFLTVVMDAMEQLFYSLSIAMGIMIAYGSYVNDEDNLGKSINQIEIFDTAVAFLAGVMIIPAVYVFAGKEGMSAGPSLMFVSLPKVFMSMGAVGNVVGCLFFAMVLFAAITSSMSILEAVVSSFMDQFKVSRKKGTIIETAIAMVLAILVCLGYNLFYFELKLPNGTSGQILDIFDYISNYIMMPVVAIATCILIGWIVGPQFTIREVEKGGNRMGRKRVFAVMIKYIAPLFLLVLLFQSLGILNLVE